MNDFERIKLLLWSEWDPIGVNGWGGPEDEYDSYAPRVLRMAQEGASVEAIAAYLDEVVVERMEYGRVSPKVGPSQRRLARS